MSTNIYILKLQEGRYYVGKTDNAMKRYQEHLNGLGSAWTRKYRPIGVEKIIEKASPFDEDRYVKEYMHKYGIEKVRGGAYVMEELPDFQEEALKSELWGATNKCTTCGRKGHWAKDCYASKDITGKKIVDESEEKEGVWECEYCNQPFKTYNSALKHEMSCSQIHIKTKSVKMGTCFRCGHEGHYANNCYARRNVNGEEIDSDNDFDDGEEDEEEEDEFEDECEDQDEGDYDFNDYD